jgi:hypothetical protein
MLLIFIFDPNRKERDIVYGLLCVKSRFKGTKEIKNKVYITLDYRSTNWWLGEGGGV